ncbi:MAG: phospholipid/cholesterol/gamma-HCH transport system permease protein, partial [Alphaproteobacteria bacterium]|nr:phospholipid/cholesterol/gamma-HCH transport system permease protein [Alphaproteobacteria bacterium]
MRFFFGGDWVIEEIAALDKSLHTLELGGAREVEFDGSEITRMDSAGAWLILRAKHQLSEAGAKIRGITVPDSYRPLLEKLDREIKGPPPSPPPHRPFTDFLARMGRGTTEMAETAYRLLGFLGRITVEAFEALVRPTRELPWPAFVNQIEATGLTAVPIVGLLSFLLGVVL